VAYSKARKGSEGSTGTNIKFQQMPQGLILNTNATGEANVILNII
jgi:hypothetical protein